VDCVLQTEGGEVGEGRGKYVVEDRWEGHLSVV
jgi:hypothetical protein